jgi:hypothetical protein
LKEIDMSKNVMIPLSLMERTIDLLGYLQPTVYNDIRYEHCDVLQELLIKKQKLEIREAYGKIISARNEEARHDARIEYLRLKGFLRDMEKECAEVPF